MAVLTWSNELRIGIGDFDREHLEIVESINTIQTEVEGDNEQAVTGPLLRKLASDTVAHFKAEEIMMEAAKYPGLALHGMKHQHLLEQLSAFLTGHSRDGASMYQHSLNFLPDWVSTHIQSEDMNFGLWLNEHGKR